jgi:hypothetical protein
MSWQPSAATRFGANILRAIKDLAMPPDMMLP